MGNCCGGSPEPASAARLGSTQAQLLLDVATTYSNKAGELMEQRDFIRALKHFRKALAIRLNALGPNHPDVAMTYYNIGLACHSQGKPDEARQNWRKAAAAFNAAGVDNEQSRYVAQFEARQNWRKAAAAFKAAGVLRAANE